MTVCIFTYCPVPLLCLSDNLIRTSHNDADFVSVVTVGR